ncbi:hypothetical protein [Actinomadura sp. 3N407]|uniref:hypothetical protein n=1 Tax=Actinomadura sp. 3N407 TaxID=3457423 RepID=UPI003FCEAD26
MKPHMTRPAWRVGTACGGLLLALCAGCGGERASGGDSAATSAAPRSMSIEQLGAELDCEPQRRGKAADYRQAICAAPSGKYLLNTFESGRAQNDWLEHSKMYGGTYLVGHRWIVVSKPELLSSLRGQVGGRLVNAGKSG